MSADPGRRPHYLRGNRGERSPSRVLVLDTETRWEREEETEAHRLRLWSAQLINRHGVHPGEDRTSNYEGLTVDDLLATVEALARPKEPLWLFAHNLSFDLAVTALPVHLRHRGWKLGMHNLASEAPWAHLTRKDRSLWLCDSHSWLPVSVDRLGEMLGVAKLPLPQPDDPDQDWADRCRVDVQITALSLCQLMDEWDRRQLGWWSMTGPGSAWNSMLHAAHKGAVASPAEPAGAPADFAYLGRGWKVKIDPLPEGRAFERRSLFSGRRDVWQVGRMPAGKYVELDIRAAHLAIAAHFPLPAQRLRHYDRLPLTDWHLDSDAGSVISECLLETSEPRYPLHWRGTVLHPVGRFKTVLCGPELREARDRGHLLELGESWSYALGRQMQPWASWALDYLSQDPEGADPVLWTFLKMASRSVPGRWGMLVSRELERRPSPHLGWHLEEACFEVPPRRGAILHLAGELWKLVRDQEADDSFPAVLAFIQSYCRLALNRALDALGPVAAVSCNTEGIIAPATAVGRLEALNAAIAPLEVRAKRTMERVEVISPQHLRLDEDRRLSGIPRSAVEFEPDAFAFWTWPKLAGQLKQGGLEGFTRELREVRIPLAAVTRWVYECGCAVPPTAYQAAGGGNGLYGAPYPRCPHHGGLLMATQHHSLKGLPPAA